MDRLSSQLSNFLLRKMISASSRFIQLKVQFFLPKIYHGYMYI